MQNPIVTIQTTQGTLKVELYPEVAPNTVNNFITWSSAAFTTAPIPPRHPRLYDSGRRPGGHRHGRPRRTASRASLL